MAAFQCKQRQNSDTALTKEKSQVGTCLHASCQKLKAVLLAQGGLLRFSRFAILLASASSSLGTPSRRVNSWDSWPTIRCTCCYGTVTQAPSRRFLFGAVAMCNSFIFCPPNVLQAGSDDEYEKLTGLLSVSRSHMQTAL